MELTPELATQRANEAENQQKEKAPSSLEERYRYVIEQIDRKCKHPKKVIRYYYIPRGIGDAELVKMLTEEGWSVQSVEIKGGRGTYTQWKVTW